ncbi:TetR/AcrR family transcriptional regulator [Cnuibacter sp. UC19_7]|uniref:TetR/AcrR family transcriptional regulator n=1 Tax=Cnuibacter sp. UC19_7 TaxID=3350166 RepID=UPI00366E470A
MPTLTPSASRAPGAPRSPRVPRAPRKDALENRAAILDAAATVFRRDPEAAIDAVATEAGLSRRAVYGHFSSRDDLLAELLERGGRRISEALTGVRHDDPRIHLALIGGALYGQVAEVKVLASSLLHSPLEQLAGRALQPVRRSVRDAVVRGAAAGHFRDDIDPEALARLVEDAAIAVLDEAVRSELEHGEARRLVMSVGLSVAGLAWREAVEVTDTATALMPAAGGAA